MRQLGDLLVWIGLIAVLVAVIHFTPIFAQYMSSDSSSVPAGLAGRNLAFKSLADDESPD